MKSFIGIFKAKSKIFLRSKKDLFWIFILPLGLIFLCSFILDDQGQKISFAYILPGIMAAALMHLGFGGALKFLRFRERNILKGFRITPFPLRQILSSEILLRILMGLVQMGLIILLVVNFFEINLEVNLILIFLIIFLGLLTFLSLGYMLICFVKSNEDGKVWAQIIQVIMIFLSGIFFPVDMMPEFIQPVAQIMPLTYLVDLLREVIVGIPGYFSLNINLFILITCLILTSMFTIKFWSWE